MIKFSVLSRWSTAVKFVAEIDCDESASMSVKLGLAVKWAIKSGANLSYADLSYADLGGANLGGADLSSANLSYANLSYANLSGQWIIQGASRSDGYAFFLQRLKDETEPMIRAGCRYFTIPDAEKHWHKTRGGTPLGDETFAIIDGMVKLAQIRGLIPSDVHAIPEDLF